MYLTNVLSGLAKDLCTKPNLSSIIKSIPAGTFSYSKFKRTLHKNDGMSYLDYACQLPYLKVLTAPPVFVFFFLITLLIAAGADLYLVFDE